MGKPIFIMDQNKTRLINLHSIKEIKLSPSKGNAVIRVVGEDYDTTTDISEIRLLEYLEILKRG